jgi:hypothetical protein
MELFVRTGEMTQDDESDILLPEQYNDLRRRHHELRGELRLMFAVLEDAIRPRSVAFQMGSDRCVRFSGRLPRGLGREPKELFFAVGRSVAR